MARKRKCRKDIYPNNVWNRGEFRWRFLRGRIKLFTLIKEFVRCIKWSRQRILRGYADCDRWGMYYYLQRLIPDMLQDLKDNRMGSPVRQEDVCVNEDGVTVNDTCHEEWDKILDQMIFLWREVDEETCSRKNLYEEKYYGANVP